jgi:hypothetical protein
MPEAQIRFQKIVEFRNARPAPSRPEIHQSHFPGVLVGAPRYLGYYEVIDGSRRGNGGRQI